MIIKSKTATILPAEGRPGLFNYEVRQNGVMFVHGGPVTEDVARRNVRTMGAHIEGDYDATLKTLTVEDVRKAMANSGYGDGKDILSARFVDETPSGMMYEITFNGESDEVETGKVFIESMSGQLFGEY